MKVEDVIVEKQVESSWIHDISYDGVNVILTVTNGRKYIVNGVPKNVYQNWLRSKSKGRFWNKRLRNVYKATSIA